MKRLELTAIHYLKASAFFHFVPVDDNLYFSDSIISNASPKNFPYSYAGAKDLLTHWSGELRPISNELDTDTIEKEIYKRLAVEHYTRSLDCLSDKEKKIIQDETNPEILASKLYSVIKNYLVDWGVDIPDGSIEILDEFPAPYNGAGFTALTLDAGDKEKLGLEPGVFLLSGGYVPIFSQALVFHEFIHVILGEKSPQVMCRGLEEGLCEFLGALYLFSQHAGESVAKNSFVYSRLRPNQKPVWNHYLQMTRQAILIYRHYGLSGILEMLRHGREGIKSIERALWDGNAIQELNLPRSESDPKFLNFCEWLADVASRQTALTPGAYLIFSYATEGASAAQISNELSLPEDYVQQKLNELDDYLRFITLDTQGKVVAFSEVDKVYSPYELRFMRPQ